VTLCLCGNNYLGKKMQNSTKLKPNWSITIVNILWFGIIIGNAIINRENRIMFEQVWVGLYIIVGLIALLSWVNTRSLYSLNFIILCLLCLLLFGGYLETRYVKILMSVVLLLVLIFHFFLLAKVRNQWRAREILELAAKPINETTDGFTERPFPAGEIKFSEKQIKGFAAFMKKNMLAFPHFQKDIVTFILLDFDYRLLWPFKTNYSKRSYVSFDYSGKISVNIAKMDYKKFKHELTFDQLCESMGNLFKSFLSLYQVNKEKEILDRIVG
jgi:uncharacterized membrane protein